MLTLETGQMLVELCKQNKNLVAIDTLYSPDIVSIESKPFEGLSAEMQGLDAIRQKNVRWFQTQFINSISVTGSFVHGDRFSVNFKTNVTSKKDGTTRDLEEVGLYTVKKDQIVKEEFFSA